MTVKFSQYYGTPIHHKVEVALYIKDLNHSTHACIYVNLHAFLHVSQLFSY